MRGIAASPDPDGAAHWEWVEAAPKRALVAITRLPHCTAEATVTTLTASLRARHLPTGRCPMMDRRVFLTTVAGLLVVNPVDARAQQAGGSGGTSPLPPATPVQDLRSLVGKWEGRVTSSGLSASEPITWTVDADGSYDLEPFGQKGRLEIREGKVRFKNLATGRTGDRKSV